MDRYTNSLKTEISQENAFHFYIDINAYTGESAKSLFEFYEILKHIDPKSIEFHLKRKDFENWLKFIGDNILKLQIARIRKKKYNGEILRAKICEVIKNRVEKTEYS